MGGTVALPTRILALDLSLTATGAWWGNPYDPTAEHGRAEIRTPIRRKDESDLDWNVRRCRAFQMELLMIVLTQARPERVVVEITSHAHQIVTRARGTTQERRERSTKGIEFRAGIGLGRAIGWLEAMLVHASMAFPRFETIEAKDAKLRVAGSQAASKGAVAAKLFEVWGWTTDGWRESEIDALACGVAWLRTVEMDARERTYRELAASQDAVGRPSSSRRRSTPTRPIESPAP